jgi:hypothetical protein
MLNEDTHTSEAAKSFTARKLDWINRIVSDRRLTLFQRVVGVALSFYFNADSSDCYVSQKKLAERVGGTVRAVQMAIDALVAAGLLAVQVGAGKNSTNTYRMLDGLEAFSQLEEAQPHEPPFVPPARPYAHPPESPFVPPLNGDSYPLRTGIRTPPESPFVQTPVLNTCTENTCTENTCTEDISVIGEQRNLQGAQLPTIAVTEIGFENWWAIYPKKVAKAAAAKAYDKIIRSRQATESQLLAGVTRYSGERRNQDPKYTKHPTTWLNGYCWLDEPQPTGTTSRAGRPNRADSAVAGMLGYLSDGGAYGQV